MVSTYREMKPFVCLAVPLVTLNDTSTDHHTRHENYLQSRWLTDITDVPSELTLPDYGYQAALVLYSGFSSFYLLPTRNTLFNLWVDILGLTL